MIEIAPLRVEHLAEMQEIENASFDAPWPGGAYRSELTTNRLARYLGGRRDGALIGFGGIWLMVDEAHITTIAVRPSERGRGAGTELLLALLVAARAGGAALATLDVRVSNVGAQRLYERLGFRHVGRRVRYYDDNGEDALIMTTPPLNDAGQVAREELAATMVRAGAPLPDASAFDAAERTASAASVPRGVQ
ncbi:MAG: ribosomal-protein-alanine N-acetyltransferase [Chloroflexi bacterium]|jgi:ribosomal-protein-alanine N-acetyltransferase|nr:MAG: ribosomal-protein-alanine N-acetyltransferase [Chloroflexota bacterium]RLT29945.1 MAG: ribosomal-protein-alanine N-acetyltransferase [Chloroflexota bacterium]